MQGKQGHMQANLKTGAQGATTTVPTATYVDIAIWPLTPPHPPPPRPSHGIDGRMPLLGLIIKLSSFPQAEPAVHLGPEATGQALGDHEVHSIHMDA